MRVAITGCNGQLGTDLQGVLKDYDVLLLSHADLEITDPDAVQSVFDSYRPDVVINTAAYHKVDECETQFEKTFAVNAIAPRILAEACGERNARLIHFSTNFVFDGCGSQPYTELDIPAPLSVYGASKLSGEHLVRATLSSHLIIRTTGLYGVAGSGAVGKGLNFIELMIKLGRERGKVSVVDDQVMTPTATSDLAGSVKILLESEATGTYHVTNSGACSYADFARTILERAGVSATVSGISTEAYGAPARRPLYSVLDNSKLHDLSMPPMRLWDEALEAYLELRGYR